MADFAFRSGGIEGSSFDQKAGNSIGDYIRDRVLPPQAIMKDPEAKDRMIYTPRAHEGNMEAANDDTDA